MFVTSYWDILEPVTSPLHTLTLVTSALPCYSWTITQVYIILILCPSPLKYSFKYIHLAFNVQMCFCCNWVAYNVIAEEWRVIAYSSPFAIVVGLHRVYMPLVVSGTFTIGLHPLLYVWLGKEIYKVNIVSTYIVVIWEILILPQCLLEVNTESITGNTV